MRVHRDVKRNINMINDVTFYEMAKTSYCIYYYQIS